MAAEQTSNIARGTPRLSAESRQHNTALQDREVLKHAGPVRLGGQRGLAFRALLIGDEAKRTEAEGASRADTTTGSAELCVSALTRVFRKIRGLFDNRIGS